LGSTHITFGSLLRIKLKPTFEADMASPSVIVDTAMLYRDYAEVPTATSASDGAVDAKTHGSFPRKLHYVLEEMENDGLSHIASWAPHGRCFMIHKPDLFVEQVLKK
jgi:HSF-type DNA-binding